MPSLVIRHGVERAERLLRRPIYSVEAFWKLDDYEEAVFSLAPAETRQLTAGLRAAVSCSADQNIVLGWTQGSTVVEVAVDQLAVVTSALTGAFIRNDSTGLTSIVRVVSF